MKPRPFAYALPRTLDEAVGLLRAEVGAVPLAGGQSVIPALAQRELSPSLLVDLTTLTELRGLDLAGGTLRIGAGVPMWDLERAPVVAEHAPLLARALLTVGAPGIRSRATLGGSTAFGDPTSQLPAVLLALDATVVTTERSVGADAFFAPPRSERLARGELIVRIDVPSAAGAGHGLHHVRRTHITWPVAGAAALRTSDGYVVALYGAAPSPVVGRAGDAGGAAAAALDRAAPFDDPRGSAAYRTRVLPVLAARALRETQVAA